MCVFVIGGGDKEVGGGLISSLSLPNILPASWFVSVVNDDGLLSSAPEHAADTRICSIGTVFSNGSVTTQL